MNETLSSISNVQLCSFYEQVKIDLFNNERALTQVESGTEAATALANAIARNKADIRSAETEGLKRGLIFP